MTGAKRSRLRRRPHAQLHLPPLSAEQALVVVHVLERAISALYRAHGHAMSDLLAARLDPPALRVISVSGSLPDDDDFPF